MTRCLVADFKEALDNFLTRVPDEPRAPGMTPGAMTEDSRMTNSPLWQVDTGHWTGPGGRES